MYLTDLFNIFDILNRARNHQPLTPSERAWVQGLQTAWKAAWPLFFINLCTGVVTDLKLGTPFSWPLVISLLSSAWMAGWLAFSQARSKVISASSPEEQLLGNLMTSVARGLGTSDSNAS